MPASTRSRPPRSARSPSCSTSTRSRRRRSRSTSGRPQIAREVASAYSTAGPAAFRHRLDRPGHEAAVARSHSLRPVPRRLRGSGRRACSPAASTSCSSRPSTTCCRRRPRSTVPGARWPQPACLLPLMVQVTVETTGRMLVGTEIGAAVTALEAMPPGRHRHELRDRSVRDDRAPALPRATRSNVLVVPSERGPAVGRQRPHPLRPDPGRCSRTRTSGSSASSGSTSSAAVAARRRSTCARSPNASARPRTRRARAGVRARLLVDLLARAVPSGARVPRRSASGPTPTARGSSTRRCSKPTGTPACSWRASR